jgi:cytosine/adenosine deaminase-related metal-dependent hydrolase
MRLTDGVYADPLYGEILTHLASNDWGFQHHASQPITQQEMVRSWQRVHAVHPIDDLRWRMLHPGGGPEHPNDFVFTSLRELGAGIVLTNSGMRSGASPPYRRAYGSGTQTCLGTDALNASGYAPFPNLWFTISGKTYSGAPGVVSEQRLTRQQALEMATRKCGWFLQLEDKIGTLEVGKYADLIVLSDDFFTVPEDDIRTLTSVLTIVDGRIVYADAEYTGLDAS